MTEPPMNSEDETYLDEPFEQEALTDEEDLTEYEEEIGEDDSDTQSDTDVEAEYLRGNVSSPATRTTMTTTTTTATTTTTVTTATTVTTPPTKTTTTTTTVPHAQLEELTIKEFRLNQTIFPQPHARRQQIYGKRSASGVFARPTNSKYASSSSEDEMQQVVSQAVMAEVNRQSMSLPELTDDETVSARTLIPGSAKSIANGDVVSEGDLTDMVEEEQEEEEELEGNDTDVAYENEYDENELASNENKEDDVEIEQLELEADSEEGDDCEDQNDVKIIDGSEMDSSLPTENDLEDPEENIAMLDNPDGSKAQKKHRTHRYHPNLARKPVVDVNAPVEPKMENIYDDNGDEVFKVDGKDLIPGEQLSVKFLEQQMTQMSEMIMKTFRLSGGSAHSSAFEQLSMVTKMMKKQGNQNESEQEQIEEKLEAEEQSEEDVDEVLTAMGSFNSPSTARTRNLSRRNLRSTSNTDINELSQDEFLMDECGQGDGLLRYPHLKHSASARNSSNTSSSLHSDNTRLRPGVRRPRSEASSEFNYKNLGRKSFSFTNPQVREIERQNNILLKKMINVKPTITPTSKTNANMAKQPTAPRLTSAAVNRKKYQRQIDLDNDILKRKLEAVGSRRPIFK